MKYLKVNFILIISFLLLSCTSSALFFVNNLARFGDYESDTSIAYGTNANQKLDVYWPKDIDAVEKKDRVTVVFFYGGCWGACSDLVKEDYRFVAQALTANNIIAVIVDYRKFPNVQFPMIMNDAKRSVEWVSDNIEQYGGNSNSLFLMGHSAGAHIASMLVFNETYLKLNTYKKIKGFIGMSGPYDFLPFDEWYQPKLFYPPKSYAQSQTINYVDGTEAPSLLLYGNDDTRVKRRNIVSLTSKIKEKNGRVETHYYDDIDHADIISALSIPYRSSQPVMIDIVNFIIKTLNDSNLKSRNTRGNL